MRRRLMAAALLILTDTLLRAQDRLTTAAPAPDGCRSFLGSVLRPARKRQDHILKALKHEQRGRLIALQKRQLRERELCITNPRLCRYPGALLDVEERQRQELSQLKANQQAEMKRLSQRRERLLERLMEKAPACRQ